MIAFFAVTAVAVLTPDPRIQELLAQADGNPDDASIVSIEQTVLRMLFALGLAWAGRRIHGKHVGVHECNRYGFGVSWTRIHRLGSRIMRLGFTSNACSNVICVEGDAKGPSCAFTLKLQSTAEGFGKQKEHELKYFSLGGGHLNQ